MQSLLPSLGELVLSDNNNLRVYTAEIVASYVEQNRVPLEAVGDLIASIYSTLQSIQSGGDTAQAADVTVKPTAAQIRKSITPDALISFIDGKPYKSIKRHLNTQGYTVERYREEFGLARDYPTVSPNYSKARSEMAKNMGFGRGAAPRGGRVPAPSAMTAAKRMPKAKV
jgi:predicted transcriptional regulator